MQNPPFDEGDILKAQRGSHAAFVRLIKTQEDAMYRLSKGYLKSDAECADAIQETILRAYQAIRSLREPSFFKTWLLRILINECNRIHKYRRQVIPMAELTERQKTEPSFGETKEERVHEALESLEDELRMVVTLYYLNDFPLKEIAGILELPEGTVKSRLYRAREKLASFLRPERSITNER